MISKDCPYFVFDSIITPAKPRFSRLLPARPRQTLYVTPPEARRSLQLTLFLFRYRFWCVYDRGVNRPEPRNHSHITS
jgi:hypothetical protein